MSTYVNPDELFEDEDANSNNTVDSHRFRFKKQFRPRQSAKSNANDRQRDTLEQSPQYMLQRQKDIEQSILDSSARSIALLDESEAIGLAAAGMLVHQGEQLQNTNQNLDIIDANLNESHNHLNGISSVLHEFKNYLTRKIDKTLHRSHSSPCQKSRPKKNHLNVAIDKLSRHSDEDLYQSNISKSLDSLEVPKSAPIVNSQRVNEQLDANLNEMTQYITRLKGLGLAIGVEIEQQTELIDTIQNKVDVADIKIGKQNRQMNKILGK